MRWRQIIPLVGIIAVLPLLYLLFPRQDNADALGDFRDWTPSHGEIARRLGRGTGVYSDARHISFARLFQQRFRNHEHAVGLKFVSDHKMKAMFAPLIPRWDMARVALAAREEARDLFRVDYDVDIYETYITAPMRKIGELRAEPGTTRVRVLFDDRLGQKEWQERMEAYRRSVLARRALFLHSVLPWPGPPLSSSNLQAFREPDRPAGAVDHAPPTPDRAAHTGPVHP
ncbi:MAG: hypothetical protein ACP5VE_02440 [Chthonomonadales bacterium]